MDVDHIGDDEMPFLEDEDYDNFGFNLEPDFIQKSTSWLPKPLREYIAQGSAQQRKLKCGFFAAVLIIATLFGLIVGVSIFVSVMGAVAGSDDEDTPSVPHPDIFDIYNSTISLLVTANGTVVFYSDEGFLRVDSTARQSRYDYIIYPTENNNYHNNISEYANAQTSWVVNNGICRNYGSHYSDLLGWVSKSKFRGNVTINDQVCQVWQRNDTSNVNRTRSFELVACGNIPVSYTLNVNVSGSTLQQVIQFSDFQEDTVNAAHFRTPEACLGDGEICKAQADVVTDMLLIYSHTSPNFTLREQNVQDSQGGAAYLCDRFSGAVLDKSLYISQMQVTVNTTWGQFGNCEEGIDRCNGGNAYSVGRAASFRVKDNEGQCTNNEDTGSWYSLTTDSRCDNDQTVGEDKCSWKVVKVVRTISMECLLSKDFIEACRGDKGYPFTDSTNVLLQALETCPNTNVEGNGESVPNEPKMVSTLSLSRQEVNVNDHFYENDDTHLFLVSHLF